MKKNVVSCKSGKIDFLSALQRFVTVAGLILFMMSTTSTTTTSNLVAALSSTPSPQVKVAVLGATGRLGRATVEELIKRNIQVCCLVRPTTTIPNDWPLDKVIVVKGELMSSSGRPSNELLETLGDCTHCVAVYGATRRTKLSDFFSSSQVEDTDPSHAKQINYESMKALVEVCRKRKTHIVRVTGKAEDPTSFFSVLINGLGSFAKGWNYEGEQVLRTQSSSDVPYTIVRPGVMKDDPDLPSDEEYLELADNGGDLPVSAVSYQQIAQLLVECCLSSSSQNVTLCAMNVKGKPSGSLVDRVKSLKADTRKFPASLIQEHKNAVYKAATMVLGSFTIVGVGIISFIIKFAVGK
jgi:hypothetical protein